MGGYDIIGDIHGHHDKLEALLTHLRYQRDAHGVWRSTIGRRAIFVGDLIDRGPSQSEVLATVRAMVERGDALIVMGNHEFNAIGWATEDPAREGVALRPHTAKNFDQHAAFLALDPQERAEWVAWFTTLPLWIEIGENDGGPLRVVHACWNDEAVAYLAPLLDDQHRFASPEQIVLAFRPMVPDPKSPGASVEPNRFYEAVDTLLKGPEIDVHDYGAKEFRDKGGVVRRYARLRWWRLGETRFDRLAEIAPDGMDGNGEPYGELVTAELRPDDRRKIYADEVPVVFGHHWRSWGVQAPLEHIDYTAVAACVDFSAAREGPLVAYRFDGPGPIEPARFARVPQHGETPLPGDESSDS